jgi:hypothetical protein
MAIVFFFKKKKNFRHGIIVLKPCLARRVDPRLEPGRVEEKIRERKIQHDPGPGLWIEPATERD